MALKKQYIANIKTYGNQEKETILFPNAYFVIKNIFGTKNLIEFNMIAYDSEDKTIEIGDFYYAFPPSVEEGSDNFIKQGYEYLKTLPEFAEAVDC